jgi:hypothetical protein
MANSKITDLTDLTAELADELPVNRAGSDGKITVAEICTLAADPPSNDGNALGVSGTAWSDLFLASGGVINFNAGNVTLTHSAGTLTTNAALVITDGFNSLTLGSQTWTFNGSSLGDTLLLSSGGSERLRIIDKGIGTEGTALFKMPTAATFQFGNSDAASPVAQTLRVQSVSGGTSDTAGANFTVKGSQGTGTGAGGSVIFQTAPSGTTGSSQNTLVTSLTLGGSKGTVTAGKAFIETVVALSDGATPALDASQGNIFYLDAAGDRTIAVPSNAVNGQKIVIRHFANGGSRTLALNTGAGGFRFGTDITALTATGSGLMDYIGCIYNGVDSFWDVIAYTKGF